MSELSAWFGGTFDPIHLGHLNCARDLAAVTGVNKITLLPNNVPPHRPQPEATAEQRLAMLKLAIAGDRLFDIDIHELERDQPSWTITTLQELRDTLGQQKPLAFIIGQDSLLSLNQWHQWQQIPELCHLLVCQRPGYSRRHPEAKMQAWIERHLVSTSQALHQAPAGGIFLTDTPFYSISATDIRRRNRLGLACDDLLPAAVNRYIRQTGLYRD